MPTALLRKRVKRLEEHARPPSLSPAELEEQLAALRASGADEMEVLAHSVGVDPGRLHKVGFPPGEYCIFDCDLIRLPDHWAAQHEDRFVRLVGQLDAGVLCVTIQKNADSRLPLSVPASTNWRSWDPLVVMALVPVTWTTSTWRAYWRLPSPRPSLFTAVVRRAMNMARSFTADRPPKFVEVVRREVASRIDWILDQHEEPKNLPWSRRSASAR